MTGILLLDKPEGWTSHDAVAKARRIFGEKRIGHGGTLDPMATGVLPLFIGRATRAVEFIERADKEYVASLRLGVRTDTMDTTGTVLETKPCDIGEEELRAALPGFTGRREQTPPMYSAKKFAGKKLYEYARAGKEVERPAAEITISALELLGRDGEDFVLRVECSKGTYIRVLCDEIGAALGCGGAMSALRRTRFGSYKVENCVSMDALLTAEDPSALLLPIDSMFTGLPRVDIDAAGEKKCRCGADVPYGGEERGRVRVYGVTGEFLMLAEVYRGELKTVKSFFEV
jgi:tRNA pseudouridine55 synthase